MPRAPIVLLLAAAGLAPATSAAAPLDLHVQAMEHVPPAMSAILVGWSKDGKRAAFLVTSTGRQRCGKGDAECGRWDLVITRTSDFRRLRRFRRLCRWSVPAGRGMASASCSSNRTVARRIARHKLGAPADESTFLKSAARAVGVTVAVGQGRKRWSAVVPAGQLVARGVAKTCLAGTSWTYVWARIDSQRAVVVLSPPRPRAKGCRFAGKRHLGGQVVAVVTRAPASQP